ncbi:MAG: TolB family protein [Bryobacteraceae bacterium]
MKRVIAVTICWGWLWAQTGPLPESTDVGVTGQPGRTHYDAAAAAYRITGAGANIWAAEDSFHFAWKKASGDVTITAAIEWTDPGGHAHKKAGPMLRASLDADAPHASVMVHADGLIALQYRREKGGATAEIRSPVKAPARVRLARYGQVISFEVARPGGEFQPGGALTVELPETVYAGLAVCSHDAARAETAVFTGVEVIEEGVVAEKDRVVESTLEVVDIRTGERRIVRRALEHFEAPNWTPDGKALIYNGGGRMWRIPVEGGTPEWIPTGEVRCNNDHVISADGKWLAISGSVGREPSKIYMVPVAGGEPRLVTPKGPSYLHGWSPEMKKLVYCGQRDGEYDIYEIPAEGGEERRLTDARGLDDGPEYSPDGRLIYFNSERTGLMRIWGMNADGSGQRMISQGPESADWFAHFSPDGKWIAYLSYDKSVQGHPPNKDVVIRLAEAGGASPRVLVTLFGGQGTMNVPNWAPDSTRFAFVSYRLVKKR